jgi:hypothetical protein
MKRVVILLILTVVSYPAVSGVFAQNWTQGPPLSAMPPTGVPMPVMAQPGTGPGPGPAFDPSCPPPNCGPSPCPPPCPPPTCGPPPCGPMPCGPARRYSLGCMVGWQANSDLGNIKFSSRGVPAFNLTDQRIDLQLDGVWLGASSRVELSDGMSVRVEYRHLFPSKKTVETVSPLRPAFPQTRTFSHGRYEWDVVDASAALDMACGISAIGGLRWDRMSLSLSHPPLSTSASLPIDFSSPSDQGDLSINSFQTYGGAEFAMTGCDGGILVRVIGSPWVPTTINYGMTFGSGNDHLPWIRDHMVVDSKWSSFMETSLYVSKKLACDITLGAFGLINVMWAHGEDNLTSTANLPGVEDKQRFDVDLNRRSLVIGGDVALAFPSPW